MNATQIPGTGIPLEVMEDAHLVAQCIGAGTPIPEEAFRRVQDRAGRIRVDVLAKHGIVDIGVPSIREFRGEIPAP